MVLPLAKSEGRHLEEYWMKYLPYHFFGIPPCVLFTGIVRTLTRGEHLWLHPGTVGGQLLRAILRGWQSLSSLVTCSWLLICLCTNSVLVTLICRLHACVFNISHLHVVCFCFHYIFSSSHLIFWKLSEKVYPFSSDVFGQV